MKTSPLFKAFLMLGIFALLPTITQARHLYVTVTGAGNHSGTSWGNACTITEAAWNEETCIQWPAASCPTNLSKPGDSIWVAQGSYLRNTNDPFRPGILLTGIKMYGGFAGNETSFSQRNPTLYKTVFLNFDGNGGATDIVTSTASNYYPTIDGVTIRNSRCIFNYGNNTLNNCVFDGCVTRFNYTNQLKVTGCTFINGGGLDVSDGTPTFTNCTFRKLTENSTTAAAVIRCNQGGTFISCVFDSLYSKSAFGGAIYSKVILTVQNCLFTNNTCLGSGGAIYMTGNQGKIINNTFYNNKAMGSNNARGNAIFDFFGQNTIANNIMWASAPSTISLFYIDPAYEQSNVLSNNIIQDGTGGGLTYDPLLGNDYKLSPCSKAINAGNNTYASGLTTDLAGNARIAFGAVDIGCYEHTGAYVGNLGITSNISSVCSGSSPVQLQFTSTYTGPSTYYWYSPDSIFATTVPQITVYPTLTNISYYVTQQTNLGCQRTSAPVNITVYPALTSPIVLSSSTPIFDVICRGTNVSMTFTAGTGGAPGCTDNFRYSVDGGTSWQNYIPNTNINTTAAYGSVIVQGRRGGCTGCPYTDWSLMANWPVKQIVNPTVNIIGSTVLQQGQPATYTTATTYSGTAPLYSWKLNGQSVGGNTSSYTVNSPANGDVLTCTLTSNSAECLGYTTVHDTVTLAVGAIYITSPNLCINQPLTLNFNRNPSVVYWQHYTNSPNSDTAYVRWDATGTAVLSGTGGFGGVCTDAQDNVYVADNAVVRKYAPGQSTGVVVAGNLVTGAGSGADQLRGASALHVDANGNLYILDALNFRVQKWAPGATAGTTVAGGNGQGFGNNQFWNNLNSMVVTGVGDVYVADPGNQRIQRWQPGATTGETALSVPGVTAIAVDDRGMSDTIYVASGSEVRKWAYGASSGVVVAGGNGMGSASNQFNSYLPAISRNVNGDLYVVDRNNGRVQLWRRGATTGITVAGVGGYGYGPTQLGDATGIAYNTNGDLYVAQAPATPGTAKLLKFASQFPDVTYLPFESGPFSAMVYTFNNAIIYSNTLWINDAVTPSVSIATTNNVVCQGGFANFTPTAVNGGSAPKYMWYVNGILKDSTTGNWITNILQPGDNVYCKLVSSEECVTTDTATSNVITMKPFIIAVSITAEPSDVVCQGDPVTFKSFTKNAGSAPSYAWLVNGSAYGNGSSITYPNPGHNDVVKCILTSSSGCSAQPTDTSNSISIKVSSTTLTAAGTCAGSVLTNSSTILPSQLEWLRNDTVVRTVMPQWNNNGTVLLNNTYGLGIFTDGGGSLYLSDIYAYNVKRYEPGDTTGVIVAGGNGSGYSGNLMNQPAGLCVDTAGNIYVADYYRVTKWSAHGDYLGDVAGTGSPGAGANQLNGAGNVFMDEGGNLYVCDELNSRVQKFAPGSTTGITVAGGNGNGNGANETPYPKGIDIDAAGNIYVVDYSNDRIQKWAPGATTGTTVAGGNGRGTAPNQLYAPTTVHLDGAGNMFITQANGAVALWKTGASAGTTILSGTNSHTSTMNGAGDIFVLNRNDGKVVEYPVQSIIDTFTANIGGDYKARITNFSGCAITTDESIIHPIDTPSLTIVSNQGDTVCQGKTVTFSATALNAGSSPIYLWTKNGLPVGDGTSIYMANFVLQNDTIKCTVQTNNACLNTTIASSNKIAMHVRGLVYGTGNAYINPGDSLYIGGQVVADTGTYVLTLASVYDCDSIVTMHYSWCVPTYDTLHSSICAGDSLLFNGRALSIAGVYSDTLSNINGCDSIVTVVLNVLPVATYSFSSTICNNENFAFGSQLLSAAGTYIDTLTAVNGCDSIVTLNLSVLPIATSSVNQSICAGSTYIFNGQALGVAGIYTDTLTALNGCDSVVTLTLSVLPVAATSLSQSICAGVTFNFNGQLISTAGVYSDTLTAANGCDSVVTLNLSIFAVAHSSISQTICPGATYIFNGSVLTNTGIYNDTLSAANSCDSIITLNLSVLPVVHTTLNKSICTGSSYVFNGLTLTASGIYYDTLTTVSGCDSLVTLNLAVNSTLYDTLNQSICAGSIYTFNGTSLSAAGIYQDTLTAVGGCDSIVVLHLSILQAVSTSTSATVCSNTGYNFNGQILNAAGVYYDTLTTTSGCDSIVTLTLAVLPPALSSISENICSGSSFAFNGQVLSAAGMYYDTLTAVNGCDSIVTLSLTVTPALTTSFSQSICAGGAYNFNGTILTAAGAYNDTISTANGCDSIVTLNLTVTPAVTTSLSQSICAGGSYNFNGAILTTAGVYTDTLQTANGCDSVVTLTLTQQTINTVATVSGAVCTATQTGATYQWYNCTTNQLIQGATAQTYIAMQNGSYQCAVTVGNCTDTTNCISVISIGINDVVGYSFNLYPNPSTGIFTIQHNYEGVLSVRITDAFGRVVVTEAEIDTQVKQLDLSIYAAGVYVAAIMNDGKLIKTLNVIKY